MRVALFVCAVLWVNPAFGWVKDNVQPFPDGEATVILHRFCLNTCDSLTQAEWRTLIRRAIGEWNNAGANFFFATRAARSSDDPCYPPQGTVSVIFTDDGQLCPGDGRIPGVQNGASGGAAATAPGYGVVYVFLREERFIGDGIFPRAHSLLLHEFGHIVGLDHPDKYGQNVSAIMNSDGNYTRRVAAGTLLDFVGLEPDDIAGIRALYGTRAGQTSLQATLEAPTQGQTLTGVGLLRGWACDAERVSVRIDGGAPIPVLIGSPRADTQSVCGHADTGFALLMNWNTLGAGDHTLDLFIDGQLATSRTVTVLTYGQEFMAGKGGEWVLEDWPEPGTDTTVAWNEATQNIEIVDIAQSQASLLRETLAGMLGIWTLTTDDYQTERISINALSVDGYAASGVSEDRWPLTVFGSSGHYGLLLWWSGSDGCHEYRFNLVTPSRMEGVYQWTPSGCNTQNAPFYEYRFTGQKH